VTVSVTQVDFYVMGAADPRARLTTACRLAEKAYEQGLRVAVRTSSPSETAEVDELMWTFSDRSFVPHAVWPAEPAVAEATPVLLASGALPDSHRGALINLAAELPAEPARFARICEVVGGDEDSKKRARLRWRAYREAGLTPEMHEL
jgi:DNA polymerase-3 subunit chi